ncbi:MAG: hypothetical protein RR334_02875 [Clostridia bacterium]
MDTIGLIEKKHEINAQTKKIANKANSVLFLKKSFKLAFEKTFILGLFLIKNGNKISSIIKSKKNIKFTEEDGITKENIEPKKSRIIGHNIYIIKVQNKILLRVSVFAFLLILKHLLICYL